MSAVDTTFVNLRRLAGQLGLPAAWLRSEADAGRLPHLKVGRSLRFELSAVEAALASRAAVGASSSDGSPSQPRCAQEVTSNAR